MEILFKGKNFLNSKKDVFENFIQQENLLNDLKTFEIIETFENISRYWISNNCKIKKLIQELEMGFIIAWTKKLNLEKLIKINFQNYKNLDEPFYDADLKSTLYGRPIGIAVHWIAGNIPLLGIISLFQSLITRNKSIIKVPYNLKDVLPKILKDLSNNNFIKAKNKKILDKLLNSTLIIYIDKDDEKNQRRISKVADIRIVWGNLEAVSNVAKLPKKINCRDLIFGPKISLALVTKEKLKSKKDLIKLAKNLCNDVFTFNQTGCNSPHNLIIEHGSKFNMIDIAKQLAKEFNLKSKKMTLHSDPIDKYNILEKKSIYLSSKKRNVLTGENNEWNIFFSNEELIEINEPLYCRTIFLQKVKKINHIKKIIPKNTQSLGLSVSKKRKKEIVKILSDTVIDRFPDIGKMTLYQNPWDGYLPLNQMVRWISVG